MQKEPVRFEPAPFACPSEITGQFPIVNTPNNLNGTPFTLEDGIRLFGRPVLGGFDRKGEINTASEAEVADMARAILDSNPKGRVMIGADCTVSSAPLANIGAAVAAAHGVRR